MGAIISEKSIFRPLYVDPYSVPQQRVRQERSKKRTHRYRAVWVRVSCSVQNRVKWKLKMIKLSIGRCVVKELVQYLPTRKYWHNFHILLSLSFVFLVFLFLEVLEMWLATCDLPKNKQCASVEPHTIPTGRGKIVPEMKTFENIMTTPTSVDWAARGDNNNKYVHTTPTQKAHEPWYNPTENAEFNKSVNTTYLEMFVWQVGTNRLEKMHENK